MAQKTLELLMKAEIKKETNAPDFAITDREKEVLKLMVDGKNYKEIGNDLFISKNTVKKHTANIYEKLHVSSKAAAIKMVHFYKLL
jgi:DNA-binding CsgD family transcriptional regulator